jgi:two-component system, OmpR family, sensor histidine kinase CpxA
MKVPLPLSIKFSLWLLLNLALLAVVGIGLLATQGGLGWDSLIRGPGGQRVQDLGTVIVGEFSAASPFGTVRHDVLARFSANYGAAFYLFHPTLPGASSPPDLLPKAVLARVEEGPPGGGRARTGEAGPAARDDRGPPPEPAEPPPEDGRPPPRDGTAPLVGERAPPPPRAAPPPRDGRPAGDAQRRQDAIRGRFLVHTENPSAFWLGVRLPISRPVPVTLVARVDSWWGLMRLLDLQPWVIAGVSIVVFSILFWLPFVRGITHALGLLTSATGQIAEGRFNTRVPEKRRDEIGALGGAVNRMAARLDTLVNGQKRFLADIAHELGSPLGRLQVATEILESRADPALQPHVADVREEVQHMSALVNELLAFTKAGLRPRDAVLTSIPLAPLVQRVLAREDSAGRVRADLAETASALADADLLDRALGNLVRNAGRYAPDSSVTLTVRTEGTQVTIVVADEGPGVPAEALARLGEPFYRPEAARTTEGGGAGLGLAIVKSSIEACRGTVTFRNRAPRGFEATIQLGRSPAP